MALKITCFIFTIGLAILTTEIFCKAPKKIVNGSNAVISDCPAIASIQYYNSHWCGGVFITRRHILTAAHCLAIVNSKTNRVELHDKDNMSVKSGSTNWRYPRYVHTIEKFIIHPGYTGAPPKNSDDIGIVILTKNIFLDATQSIIRLPTSYTAGGLHGTVFGWGYLKEKSGSVTDRLQKAPVTTLSYQECLRRAPTPIEPSHLCGISSKGIGFCDGDSGGPLISNGQVIGVVSMGWECGSGLPDIYTRVYSYYSWIHSVIY
ncbi:chymotrypsin-1-like [Microplitis mediator]|uniref:chymotrypsin-1-like n=1 Tax=Microplitis mediator TaxID=375433 RepID=UPI00255269B8|nr:chymotrypsin-1-like [Microplitis mediator]